MSRNLFINCAPEPLELDRAVASILSRKARHTDYRDAQVTRLRDRLLKLPVWVEETVRRVVLHRPAQFLGQSHWRRIALATGGLPP